MRIYTRLGTQEDRSTSEFLALAHIKVHQKFHVSMQLMGNEKFMQMLELSAELIPSILIHGCAGGTSQHQQSNHSNEEIPCFDTVIHYVIFSLCVHIHV